MVTSLSIESPLPHVPLTRIRFTKSNVLCALWLHPSYMRFCSVVWSRIIPVVFCGLGVLQLSSSLTGISFGIGFAAFSQGLFQVESLRSAWIHTVLLLPQGFKWSRFWVPASVSFFLTSTLDAILSDLLCQSEGPPEIQVVYHIGITLSDDNIPNPRPAFKSNTPWF